MIDFNITDKECQDLVLNIMKEDGLLSNYIPNYIPRQSQIEGVIQVWKSLREGKHFLLEGPCGYGKSAVYLIAATLENIRTNDKTVIVTAGITLQEQIYNKDLPAILKVIKELTGKDIQYAYLKGKNNFICKRKLSEAIFENATTYAPHVFQEIKKINKWSQDKNCDGDISKLNYIPLYEAWKEVACVENSECQGKNCNCYNTCYYNSLKSFAKKSKIVVTNYHLLFSDIATSNKILDNYDYLICDEAHEMPKIARNFMEEKISQFTFLNMQKKLIHLSKKYPDKFDMETLNIAPLLQISLNYFNRLTNEFRFKNEDNTMPIVKGMNIEYNSFCKTLVDFSEKANNCYDFFQEAANYNEEESDLNIATTISSISERCFEIAMNLKTICTQSDELMSYWFGMENNGLLSLHSKPVKVNNYLSRNLFDTNITSIITSATLSVDNSFNYIKDELGINEANELIAESPFDMKNQQLWYLPINAVEANKPDFRKNMIENVIDIVNACQGGALCLFTSVYNMNLAAENLKRNTKFKIFKQGDMPRHLLLEAFKNNKDSVLVGTKSFFTGIDVIGDSLRCLIIDKLPFESPNDPVMRILSNEPNGFIKYFIPDMVIALKQAVGRGVRSINDKCVITILDNRMATARYRGKIGNSFSYEKTATRDINDVKSFINNYLKEE